MAHNSYIKPGGVWPFFTLVTQAIMEAIDAGIYKAINGDDGGTWAPAAAITIGGAGLNVTGPCTIAEGDIVIPNGKTLTIENGGTFLTEAGSVTTLNGDATLSAELSVESGGSIVLRSGSFLEQKAGGAVDLKGGVTLYTGAALTMQTGATATLAAGSTLISNGDFYFGNGTNPKFDPRNWNRESMSIVSMQYESLAVGPANPVAWYDTALPGQSANAIRTRDADRVYEFWIQYHNLPPGGVLTQATIESRGITSTSGMVLPRYQIIRWRGNAAPENLSSLTTDVHTDYTDFTATAKVTTIAVTGGTHKIDPAYNYGIRVQPSYYASIASGQMGILATGMSGTYTTLEV